MERNEENQSKQRGVGLLVALLVISLGLNAYMVYTYMQGNSDSEKKGLIAQSDSLRQMLDDANITAEQLRNELNTSEQQIKDLIDENLQFETENSEIATQLDKQKIALQRTRIRVNQLIKKAEAGDPASLLAAKGEIEKLKTHNKVYKTELDSIKQAYGLLEGEYAGAKERASTLESEKNVLDEKLEKSAILRVSDIAIIPTRIRKSGDEKTEKASKTDLIKINFTIIGSDIVKPGKKDISIRILGTNKEVLTNDNETLTDSDRLVSITQEVDFTGSPVKLNLKYNQKAEYKSGKYLVEILHNGELITRSNFSLR